MHTPIDPEDHGKTALDDSQELDINQALKNTVRHVTDHVIQGKVSIREAFGIEEIELDFYIEKKVLIRKLQQICTEMTAE